MRLIVALVCALVVGIAGYLIGVYAGCDWLMRDGNLCGIYGMMVTGPLGVIVGGVLGWRAFRPPSG